MKKIIYCLLLSISIRYQSVGQTIAPPSPNATSTVNSLGSYDVSLYSGRLSYSASLKSFSLGKINFDLGVSYNSSGIKVQDIAGPVGLGWSLNAGGAITRYVVGQPDESTEGYCGPNRVGADNYWPQNASYYNHLLSGFTDGRPDKFFFSFLGFSGVFMLTPDGDPVLQSSYGLKFLYCPFNRSNGRSNGGNEEWIIADQLGNRYFFSTTEESYTTTHGENSSNTYSCVSTWYISKVITANNEVINFSYLNGNPVSYTNYSNARHKTTSGDTYYDTNITTYISSPRYLSEISCGNYQLNFKYDLDRIDFFDSKALTEIDAVQSNKTEYSYLFHYSYFTSSTGNEHRLRLDGISQSSLRTSQYINLYVFDYNTSVNLPPRNSIQTDYAGLYNSNPGSTNIADYQGGDKTPDPIRSAANILTSVINTYGAKTSFTFEPNDYGNSGHTSSTVTNGLRVKKISTIVNNAEVNNVTYDYTYPGSGYSSGMIIADPSNYTIALTESYYYSESSRAIYDLMGSNIGYSYVTARKIDGTSVQYQFTDFNVYPDYSEVPYFYNTTTSQETNVTSPCCYFLTYDETKTSLAFARGKVLHEKYFDNNNVLTREVINNYNLSTKSGDVIGVDIFDALFYGNTPFGFYYGVIGYNRSTYHFFCQDLQLVSRSETSDGVSVNYTYTYNAAVPNLVSSQTKTLSNGNIEHITFRYPFDVLNNLTINLIDPSHPINYLVKTNTIAHPIETVKSVISNNVEKLTSVNITKYGGTSSGFVQPYKQYQLNVSQPKLLSNYIPYSVTATAGGETETIDSDLEPAQLFGYDNLNNINLTKNSYSEDDAISAIWGYNSTNPILQASNAEPVDVFFENFEENSSPLVVNGIAHTGNSFYSGTSYTVNWIPPSSGKTYVVSYWFRNSGVWKYAAPQSYTGSSITLSSGDAYDDILICPSDALITTYTYEPMVGITSSTDAKGKTTSYEYDDFNRLKNIRDGYKNISKSFAYNLVPPPGPYSNDYQAGPFIPTNCGSGLGGIPVVYTIQAGAVTSPYSKDDANNLAIATGQNYASTHGGCIVPFYVRLEYSNYTNPSWSYDQDNFGQDYDADAYIKLYSDANCTIPFTLNQSFGVTVAETSTVIYGYGGGANPYGTNIYTVPANASSYYIGSLTLTRSQTYTDPRSGSGNVTDSYQNDFAVIAASVGYIPVPTKP